MKNPISAGLLTGILSLVGISFIGHGLYTGRLAFASKAKPAIFMTQCNEPQVTSIKFNTEILKFLMLNDRLNLLVPLPITGSSATIVDIRATMKKVRK